MSRQSKKRKVGCHRFKCVSQLCMSRLLRMSKLSNKEMNGLSKVGIIIVFKVGMGKLSKLG